MSSNFRHQLLSLSLLVGIAAPWAAFAQAPISSVGSGSVEDRVTQLERISNAHSQLLTQLQQQLSDNQSDIDSLRGQIQENQYQLNQVVERQKADPVADRQPQQRWCSGAINQRRSKRCGGINDADS